MQQGDIQGTEVAAEIVGSDVVCVGKFTLLCWEVVCLILEKIHYSTTKQWNVYV